MKRSSIQIPFTLSSKSTPSPSLVELAYVPPRNPVYKQLSPPDLRDKLNERAVVFLMNSKELKQRAKMEFETRGLGAFLVRFANLEELCSVQRSLRLQYVDAVSLTRLNYPEALKLVQAYDPLDSFVLMIGVNTSPNDTTYASCIVDSNTEDRIRDRVMREVDAGNLTLAEVGLEM